MRFRRNRELRNLVFRCGVMGLTAAGPLMAGNGTLEMAQELQKARDLSAAGRYEEAEQFTQKLLAEAEAHHGSEAAQVAEVLDVLVNARCLGGKAVEYESVDFARRSLAIREKSFGPESPKLTESLEGMACLFWVRGEYSGARPILERSLAIREKALGTEHPEVAATLNKLALVLKYTGDYAGARRLYERALAIHQKAFGLDHPSIAQTLYNFAVLLRFMGEHHRARSLFERVLNITEKNHGPDHPLVASSLSSLGLLLRTTGDYAGARPLLERALRIREEALGPEHPETGRSLNNLAILFHSTGDYSEALALYRRGLRIAEKTLGTEHPDIAQYLINISSILPLMGDSAGASSLSERALKISRSLGSEHPLVARILNSLGSHLDSAGDHTRAREMHQRALRIREKTFDPQHTAIAETLNNLAASLLDTGDYTSARPLFERSLAIREDVLGTEHPLVALVLYNLAKLMWYQGELTEALQAATRAESISREHVRLTIRTLPERLALRYASTRWPGLDLGLSSAIEAPTPEATESAWEALILSRNMVFDEMAARHRVSTSADDANLAVVWEEFVATSQRLADLAIRSPPENQPAIYRQLLDQARQEKDRAELALARTSFSFRKLQEQSRIGFSEVALSLPRGSALLAYALYDRPSRPTVGSTKTRDPSPESSYLAFILTAGEEAPSMLDLGPATEINARVSRWRDEVTRYSERRYRQAGRRLREAIWDPVEELLTASQRVFVVPDGVLHLVNLAALPVDEERYLVENVAIHYLSAERDLVATQIESSKASGILALGGVAFDAADLYAALARDEGPSGSANRSEGAGPASTPAEGIPKARVFRGARSACDFFRSARFESLPATTAEVEEVTAIWRQQNAVARRIRGSGSVAAQESRAEVLRLTGSQANETAFKEQAPGYRVLHLATHGFFLGDRCPSVLAENLPAGDPTRPPPATRGENPMLLSGLALAGANHRQHAGPDEDDGILTAEEIAAMDLSGVEWVVLSACDTGAGEILPGEGVFGLRRAFRVAGARTLIMSLWTVDDDSTRRWMRALYEARMVRDLGTAEAVREAGRQALYRRREEGKSTHPRYWGGFVAEGVWE